MGGHFVSGSILGACLPSLTVHCSFGRRSALGERIWRQRLRVPPREGNLLPPFLFPLTPFGARHLRNEWRKLLQEGEGRGKGETIVSPNPAPAPFSGGSPLCLCSTAATTGFQSLRCSWAFSAWQRVGE